MTAGMLDIFTSFSEVKPKKQKHCYWSSGRTDLRNNFQTKHIIGAVIAYVSLLPQLSTLQKTTAYCAQPTRDTFQRPSNKSPRSVPCQIHSDPKLTLKLNKQK